MRLAQYIDKEISTIDLEKDQISKTCVDSALVLFDKTNKKCDFLVELSDKIHNKTEEAKRAYDNNPNKVTQHNYNSLQLIALSLEMSFIL